MWMDADGEINPVSPRINFRRERDLIRSAVAASRRDISLSFSVATRSRLQELATARSGCMHLSGHGLLQGPSSYLMFEDGKGGAEIVGSELLPTLIRHPEPFKLVFVSSCHSEEIGRTFVRSGVKHVVCCEQNSELNDDATSEFIHSFYTALSEGYTLQQAYQKGKDSVTVSYRSNAESQKFILLPDDVNHHEVPIFDAEKVEWDENRTLDTRIPSVPSTFLGREVVMHTVLYSILSDERLVTLHGARGIGCSTIASSVCHYINDRLDAILNIDVIFYIQRNGEDQDVTTSLLSPLCDQLNLFGAMTTSDEQKSMADLIFDALNETKALIVVDKADRLDRRFLDLLLARTSFVKVLLTAQKPTGFISSSAVERCFQVGPLDMENASMLFAKTCVYSDTWAKRCALQKIFLSKHPWGTTGMDVSARSMILFRTVREGIPLRIIEAAKQTSEKEYGELINIDCLECA